MSDYSRENARASGQRPVVASLTTVFVLLLSVAAFWESDQAKGLVGMLSNALGKDEKPLEAGALQAIWAGVVLIGGLSLVVVACVLFPRIRLGLSLLYESSWSGIGEDVETASMIETILRLASVAAVLLLCAWLAYGATQPAPSKPSIGTGTPSVTPDQTEHGAGPGAIGTGSSKSNDGQSPSSEHSSAGHPPHEPPALGDIRSMFADLIAARLAPLETKLAALEGSLKTLLAAAGPLGAIDGTLRALVAEEHEAHARKDPVPAPSAPDLKGIETALTNLAGAVQLLAQERRGTPVGDGQQAGGVPPDLSGIKSALTEIASTIKQSGSTTPDLPGIKVALMEIAASIRQYTPPLPTTPACPIKTQGGPGKPPPRRAHPHTSGQLLGCPAAPLQQ